MKLLEMTMHEDRNVTLTALLQEAGGEFTGIRVRPAVIVLPGGAYRMCSDREADPVALEFARAGFQTFILRYTVRTGARPDIWPLPLQDYDEAYELIADHADSWYVDMNRVATCGFSAGGHLAACTATLARHRPRAALLGYPAILPEIVDYCGKGFPYPHEHVDGRTSPCFLFAACDDSLVPVKNATTFADALSDKGIRFALHIYSRGDHGFTTGAPWLNNHPVSEGAKRWVGDALEFLEEIWGAFDASGQENPGIAPKLFDDYAGVLSADCTVRFLENNEKARPVLDGALKRIDSWLDAQGYGGKTAVSAKSAFTLRKALEACGVRQEEIDALDAALKRLTENG